MLYLIGLGLNVDGISSYGLEVAKRCKKIYLENYTVEFPYSFGELQGVIDKKIIEANRDFVESLEIIDEAKKMDVALLVYGSPLVATTHITLIEEAKKSGVRTKILHSASVFDAVAETGLQPYKFGKVTSMPAWKKSFKPTSFMKIVEENKSIGAHSLILIDIGLDFSEAIEQLEKSAKERKIKLNKILICQALGTKHSKIWYKKFGDLEDLRVRGPYCFIIPGKFHFVEKELVEKLD